MSVKRATVLLAALFLWCIQGIAIASNTTEPDDAPPYFETRESQIQDLFPKATVIGPRDESMKAWPVYQLHDLLGYAFESNDFVDIPGFSGDRINLLIGLSTAGQITNLKVLKHHEPIFLHGLGPQPFLEFLDQYRGVSLRDQIILGGSQNNAQAGSRVFDGITKATVSVIVANDTILSSTREVARLSLPEFAQRAASEVRRDHFQPLSFKELLDQGLVKSWRLSYAELETQLGYPLDTYQEFNDIYELGDSGTTNSKTESAIRLHYAYLNTPVTGRNLLGDSAYQELMNSLRDGEHALAVFADSPASYLEPGFRPGTIPQRLTLSQHALPISIRDTNTTLHLMHTEPAQFNIFKIRAQAGFDPASEMELRLNFTLHKNPLVSDTASFSDSYQLPATLFIKTAHQSAKPKALWRQIWLSKVPQIAILCSALLLITIVFLRQRTLRHWSTAYRHFRWGYLAFTLVFIGAYTQGQLSVVNIYTLLLALRDGFKLDVFLLDPIIFILWCYTFVSLFLWGRGLFCGWLCPFGALQEFLSRIAVALRIPQYRITDRLHQRLIYLKYPVLIGLLGLSFTSLSTAERFAEVEPFKTAITLLFIREWPFVIYALLILGAGLFVQKAYCRYLCPLGAGLAILGHFRRLEWLDRRKECGSPCQLCNRRCQVKAITRSGAIDYNECVQCLECVVILDDPKQCAPVRATNKHSAVRHRHTEH